MVVFFFSHSSISEIAKRPFFRPRWPQRPGHPRASHLVMVRVETPNAAAASRRVLTTAVDGSGFAGMFFARSHIATATGSNMRRWPHTRCGQPCTTSCRSLARESCSRRHNWPNWTTIRSSRGYRWWWCWSFLNSRTRKPDSVTRLLRGSLPPHHRTRYRGGLPSYNSGTLPPIAGLWSDSGDGTEADGDRVGRFANHVCRSTSDQHKVRSVIRRGGGRRPVAIH